jgi:tetratricopeptide (TPR) repeat protein
LDKHNLALVSHFAKFYENFDLIEDAIKLLQKVMKKHWDDRIAYQLGMNYLNLEDYQAALPLFERQLNYDPEDTYLQYMVASILCELGDISEAENRLRRIIEVNPFEKNVHSALGGIYNDQGRYLDAKNILERGMDYHPYESVIKLELGITYKSLDEVESALEMANSVLKYEEENILAHYHKACYLARLNLRKEAQFELDFIFENDPEGYFHDLADREPDLANLKEMIN